MSTEFENNQSTGRPSEYGKAASSGARADGPRRRSEARSRSTYEAEAQALADIWDPKKRKEREEAAAREADAIARAEAARAAAREAAEAARAAAAREAAEAAKAAEVAAQEAERRKRIAALPTIETKKASIDPASVQSVSDSFAEDDATPQERSKIAVKVASPGEAVPPKEASQPKEAASPGEASQPKEAASPKEAAPVKNEGSKGEGSGRPKDDIRDEPVYPGSIVDFPPLEAEGFVDGDAEATFERNRPKKPSRRKPDQSDNRKASGKLRKSVRPKRLAAWKVVLAIVVFLLVVVVSLVAYASLSRWVFVDDAADIKGSWHLSAEPVSVVISDTEMNLADEVSYAYTMDTQAKVINETLGNMKGAARYRFSEDRNSVAIFDDSSCDWLNNAMIDLRWYVDCALAKVFGGESPDLLGGESGVIMYRAGYDAPGVVTMTTEVAEGDTGQQAAAEGDTGQQAAAEGDAQVDLADVGNGVEAPSASE